MNIRSNDLRVPEKCQYGLEGVKDVEKVRNYKVRTVENESSKIKMSEIPSQQIYFTKMSQAFLISG